LKRNKLEVRAWFVPGSPPIHIILYQSKAMDTWTIFMVLLFVVVGLLFIIAAYPSVHRGGSPDEEWERIARNQELKQMHRLRRQRDKVWFRIDSLHDEFVKRSSIEEHKKYLKPVSPSQAGSADDADNWNSITLSYLKEKYEHFLKKD
jgi:hypothetical protein